MKLRALLPWLLPLWLLALGAGCGGQHDATEKQLAELRAEIARLRAGQASLIERLDAIDIDRGAFAKGAAAPPAADPGSAPVTTGSPVGAPKPPPPSGARADQDRPELDVVRLSPNEGDGDVDNDPSRPVIRAGSGSPTVATKTLSNRNLGARSAPKKGVAAAATKSP
jgi:hypothetical protein